MLLVSTNRLKPGMQTATAVLHPHQARTRLLQQNVELTASLIGRLRELNIPCVWTRHPLLKDIEAQFDSKVPECRREIYDSVKQGFDDLQDRVITKNDYGRFRTVISGLIGQLVGQGNAGLMAERLFDEGDELAGHCANVAYLAVCVGMQLETYVARERGPIAGSGAWDLTSLGVGAILHDIGKLQLSPEIRTQHAVDGHCHDDEYRQHVLTGYELLRQNINPVAANIALNHHQQWDGGGWPDLAPLTFGRISGPLARHAIHVFARIVAAANLFDTLTARPGGPARPAIVGLYEMRSPELAAALDPLVLDTFLRQIPPFPAGVEVILNDGRSAAVIRMNPDEPCRPVIRPLEDNDNGEDVDLTAAPGLWIVECRGERVERYLFTLPPKTAAIAAATDPRYAMAGPHLPID